MIKKLWMNFKEKVQNAKKRKVLFNKIAQEVLAEDSNSKYLCSYQKCLTCPISSCHTGEMARKKGKRGFIRVLVELELAEEAKKGDGFYENK